MNRVIDILVRRDDVTVEEATEIVRETADMIREAVELGDYEEAEEIMYSELGLEMDYIFDVLEV